jgi:predicted dehydrogenase
MSGVIKVGVIGCGEIAQWMHLPFLTELPDFQVTAVCDISPKVVEYVGALRGRAPLHQG